MADYLLIESGDPFESNDVGQFYDLASDLARNGSRVTLFLVQNGVLPARRSAHSGMLSAAAAAGVEVLADDFSLAERGIDGDSLADGVSASALDAVIDRLAEGRKAIWH